MRIRVNPAACCGAGQCVLAAPQIFAQRPSDATVVLLRPDPGPQWEAAAQAAADLCPNSVIEVVEE